MRFLLLYLIFELTFVKCTKREKQGRSALHQSITWGEPKPIFFTLLAHPDLEINACSKANRVSSSLFFLLFFPNSILQSQFALLCIPTILMPLSIYYYMVLMPRESAFSLF